MAELTQVSGIQRQTARQFLTFRIDEQTYALPAEQVAEVIPSPLFARAPQAPAQLLGLANLRGSVLPYLSMRALLRTEACSTAASPLAIVWDGAAPVIIAIDRVGTLVSIQGDELQAAEAHVAAVKGESLVGVFRAGDGPLVKVLDMPTLLAAGFPRTPRPRQGAGIPNQAGPAEGRVERAPRRRTLISFEVAAQEFALELHVVREILAPPEALVTVPGGDGAILGVANYRDGLLPLLSLRSLLGFPRGSADSAEKVVVVDVGGAVVGLVADRMRSVISAEPDLIEPMPRIFAARSGGEARIGAIHRADDGGRLISILAADQLFSEVVMQRLGAGASPALATDSPQAPGATPVTLLIFRLGGDEFGLPIEAVDEVSAVPERITRLPRTPPFLEGVINLRGEVLPVVDQRRRFEMPPLSDASRRRLIVTRSADHRAGLIVDSVTEVLAGARISIEPAPDLTGESARLVSGVLNLANAGRLILILDPAELLSRAERGLLDGFEIDRARSPP